MVWDGLTGSASDTIASPWRGEQGRGTKFRVLDCGGKRSATPLWIRPVVLVVPTKALSPLRSASAVQKPPPVQAVCHPATTEALNISFAITPSDTFVTAPVMRME